LHRLERIYANEQMRPIAKNQSPTQQQQPRPPPGRPIISAKNTPTYGRDRVNGADHDFQSAKPQRVLCVSTQLDHVPHNLTVFRSPDEPGRAQIVPGCPTLTYLDWVEDSEPMFAEQRPTTEERMNSRKAPSDMRMTLINYHWHFNINAFRAREKISGPDTVKQRDFSNLKDKHPKAKYVQSR
uniref:DUF3504 domain-containing protein n=1 Tax=Echinostoma caproni TaxID=27848 RepID=A0A183AHX8_9TREM